MIPLITHKGGYNVWHTSRWDSERRERYNEFVSVHRLAAVAWFGLEAVQSKDVHHVNGVGWDNREDNLKPLSRREHVLAHLDSEPYHDERWLRDQYWTNGLSQREIAEMTDCSLSTIGKWMRHFGIQIRKPKGRKKLDDDELRRLYFEEGLTQTEIAEVFGCSQPHVSKELRRCV